MSLYNAAHNVREPSLPKEISAQHIVIFGAKIYAISLHVLQTFLGTN